MKLTSLLSPAAAVALLTAAVLAATTGVQATQDQPQATAPTAQTAPAPPAAGAPPSLSSDRGAAVHVQDQFAGGGVPAAGGGVPVGAPPAGGGPPGPPSFGITNSSGISWPRWHVPHVTFIFIESGSSTDALLM